LPSADYKIVAKGLEITSPHPRLFLVRWQWSCGTILVS
jgi:hypothetical protein